MKAKNTHKEIAINALKFAEEASLKEQEGYLKIIEKKRTNGLSRPHKPDLSWQEVLILMKGCCYPPISGERKLFLNINFDEILSRIKLEGIKDVDIRHRTYFLNELMEHTQRIRSMAMFASRVGTVDGEGGIVFAIWSKRASLEIIHAEAIEMGKTEEAESATGFIEAFDLLGSMVIEAWGETAEDGATVDELLEAVMGELYQQLELA